MYKQKKKKEKTKSVIKTHAEYGNNNASRERAGLIKKLSRDVANDPSFVRRKRSNDEFSSRAYADRAGRKISPRPPLSSPSVDPPIYLRSKE